MDREREVVRNAAKRARLEAQEIVAEKKRVEAERKRIEKAERQRVQQEKARQEKERRDVATELKVRQEEEERQRLADLGLFYSEFNSSSSPTASFQTPVEAPLAFQHQVSTKWSIAYYATNIYILVPALCAGDAHPKDQEANSSPQESR